MSFPTPSDSAIDTSLDLNQLVKNPTATFFMRVSGEDMVKAGIHPGDLLIVDRSLPPTSGRLVVAAVDGVLTVRHIQKINEIWHLTQADGHPEVVGGFEVWGVVTTVIHSV
jgi:DNA polymerase V